MTDLERVTRERDALKGQMKRISDWLLARPIEGEVLGGVDQIAIRRMEAAAAELTALRERVGEQADDGEAIDEAWLTDVGFVWCGGEQCWLMQFAGGDSATACLCFYRDCRATVGKRGDAIRCKTRGSLRLLCRALGIELTPTPGA